MEEEVQDSRKLRRVSLPPTTTAQEDIVTEGQRRINLIWEMTQAFVAISVVLANLIVGVYFGLTGKSTAEFPVVLSSSLFLIIGFYFSRTNHQRIGGTGQKANETQNYEGR